MYDSTVGAALDSLAVVRVHMRPDKTEFINAYHGGGGVQAPMPPKIYKLVEDFTPVL